MSDLHTALKTTEIARIQVGGIEFAQVRLQHGRDQFEETLHARPNSYSTAGLQRTDLLSLIGFQRSQCAFLAGECYVRRISSEFNLQAAADAIAKAYERLVTAERHLEACGLWFPKPEGYGFFFPGRSSGSSREHRHSDPCRGNGHQAPKHERMKAAQDEHFDYVFTWISGGSDKGWVTHYRGRHMPLAPAFDAALKFLGAFQWFDECPEFDFEGCWWRYTAYREMGIDGNAEYAHRAFDAHARNFSPGIRLLIEADTLLAPHGLSFLAPLKVRATSGIRLGTPGRGAAKPTARSPAPAAGFVYDVAISFAGPQRPQAEELAKALRDAGLSVFYDDFYPEQLWGVDLAATFDRIYRKESRHVVMFISQEYADRMWTTHERRSATARALQEKGGAYILPVRVEEVDVDGLPPSIGHVSLANYSIAQIAELVVKKLKG